MRRVRSIAFLPKTSSFVRCTIDKPRTLWSPTSTAWLTFLSGRNRSQPSQQGKSQCDMNNNDLLKEWKLVSHYWSPPLANDSLDIFVRVPDAGEWSSLPPHMRSADGTPVFQRTLCQTWPCLGNSQLVRDITHGILTCWARESERLPSATELRFLLNAWASFRKRKRHKTGNLCEPCIVTTERHLHRRPCENPVPPRRLRDLPLAPVALLQCHHEPYATR